MTIAHPLLRAALAVVAALSLGWGSAHATPQLIVEGGVLMGADNVVVNNVAYDVRFVDGSCFELYGDCNAVGDFVFTNRADAYAATAALLREVLVDTSSSDRFDSDPSLVEGCDEMRCSLFTPYQQKHSRVKVVGASNTGTRDRAVNDRLAVSGDTSLHTRHSYVVWTARVEPADITVTSYVDSVLQHSALVDESVSPSNTLVPEQATVPEPGILALLGLALPMFAVASRRRGIARKPSAAKLG